jgi:hypothetical protein
MSKGGTATTTTGPPAALTTDYNNLENQGTSLYSSGYPTDTALQNSGLSALQSATGSNSIGTAGQGYYNELENGSLLNPATNSSLQGLAQLSDQQIQNNLSSEFAGSGRNIEGSAPIQASQMATVASNIYGGAYNNTLNNMTSGLGQASQLEGENLMPSEAALSGAGSQLSNYAGLLGAMPGGTSSTPVYTNTGANILGGGLLGADLGSLLGSGNTGYGALLGGLLGGLG